MSAEWWGGGKGALWCVETVEAMKTSQRLEHSPINITTGQEGSEGSVGQGVKRGDSGPYAS